MSVFCVYLNAETVMVSLVNDDGAAYIGGERNRLASALVEGAMEVFFQANHIVFDLGLPSDEEDVLPDRKTAALIARIGGAAYLLDVRAGAPVGDEGPPEYLAYDFVDLITDEIISTGVVRKTEIDTEVADSLTLCLLLGEKVAAGAVATLK